MNKISKYQIEDTPLGIGGMGKVWRGVDPNGRPVAIKEILPEFVSDLEIRTRTEREVKMLRNLNNNSIVKVYDEFPLDGNFYIVMELVEGLNVEQYVQKNGPIPCERALKFMAKVLEAMQFVHENNYVHRDLKPSNIMIRKDDENICVLDFGIAKDMSTKAGATVFGTIIGSDGYMSPEQADGYSIDKRADIYALGCVLFFMLTGQHAYPTLSSDYETRQNIATKPFPKLKDHCRETFPPGLQDILDHATDRNMMKRYQTCREFSQAIQITMPSKDSHNTVRVNKTEDVCITVGREKCDITIDDPTVSRRHLYISFKQFTGGRYYVITDQSANGTLVNGNRLNQNDQETIPAEGPSPRVCLACDEKLELDWEEVRTMIADKLQASSAAGVTQVLPLEPEEEEEKKSAWAELAIIMIFLIIGAFFFSYLWIAAGASGIGVSLKKGYKKSHRIIALILGILGFVGYIILRIVFINSRY